MNKIIAPIVGAVLGVVALGWVSYDFKKDVMNASVQIGEFCSGVVIPDPFEDDGIQLTVLTAKHCVSDIAPRTDIPVTYRIEEDGYVIDKVTVSFRTKAFSDTSDLALLQSNGVFPVDLVYDIISDYDVDQGDGVYAIGYPLGGSQVITSGYAGAIDDLTKEGPGIVRRSSTVVTGGNSGGGLFYIDALGRYRLVGVCSVAFGTRNGQSSHITGWVPWKDIIEFLEGKTAVIVVPGEVDAKKAA